MKRQHCCLPKRSQQWHHAVAQGSRTASCCNASARVSSRHDGTHRAESGSLTFLAPMAGIVAACIAVPAVLLFYFLKLRRRPVRVSTIRFWQASADDLQVNAPFRMIRASWLLLLHLLITALFCVAAARPALDKGTLGGGRVVIIVDHSASMGAVDAPAEEPGLPPVTRLEAAKRRASDVIDGLGAAGAATGDANGGWFSRLLSGGFGGSGAQAMVVSMAARPVVRANFTRDAAALRKAVDAIEQTDQPADLGEALRMALAFAKGGSEEADAQEKPTVVLVTDGAVALEAGASLAGLSTLNVRLVKAGPAPGSEPGNAGIVALNARRDFQDPALVRVFVRVQSTLREAASIGVTCAFEGETMGSGVVELTAAVMGGSGGMRGAPAEASRTFELRSVLGGVVSVTLARKDALEADNQASLVLSPARPPRLLLVRPGDGVPSGAEENLKTALETLQPAALRVVSAAAYARESAAGALPAVQEQRPDLIVFDRVRPSALPTGVASISFGSGLPIEGLRVSEGEASQSGGAGGFTQWDRSHPVMRFVSLADVAVDSAGEVVTSQLPAGTSATVLAWARRGPAVVLIESGGVRRLIAAVDLGLTTWSKDVSFPTFMANAVDHLTLRGEENAARWWRTSDAVTLAAPASGAAASSLTYEVRGPHDWASEAAASDDGAVMVGVLPRAGVYRVALGDETAAVPVNLLDPSESETLVRGAVDLGGQTATAEARGSVGAVEVWTWFVLAALGLLCVEWLLFAWRSRV
ncbi:MAG: vWA domain-containing protein [Phycisphaerales bacterium]